MTEIASPVSTADQAPSPFSPFETEQVREFKPREPMPAQPVLSGPGFAPAEPVKIEWPADLMQVESDPGKVQTSQQEEVLQQPAPRPKRVRHVMQPLSEEPLVQIETGEAETGPGSSGEKDKAPVPPG